MLLEGKRLVSLILDAIGCARKVIFSMNRITLKQLVALMKLKVIVFVILNGLLLFIAAYGLWGAFWIWQPGAEPPQWAPLFGSQSYLQSIKNRGFDATLVYGFLTYRVDIWINEAQKLGVVRFDWTQFSLILLAFFDSWTLIHFLRSRKIGKFPNVKS